MDHLKLCDIWNLFEFLLTEINIRTTDKSHYNEFSYFRIMSNLVISSIQFIHIILIKLEEEYHHNHQQYHAHRSIICVEVRKILSYEATSCMSEFADGVTILMIACLYCPLDTIFPRQPSLEVIQLLLDAKANPNARDFEGNTVLHRIAKQLCLQRQQHHINTWIKVVKLLLAHGAHLDAADSTGQTFTSMQRVIRLDFVSYTSLKCLAATTIRKFQSKGYIFDVPDMFQDFIDIHYKYRL